MRVMLLPSSVTESGLRQHHFLTSYRIEDTVVIDAGSVGLAGSAEEQAQIKHVLLSHTHLDHIASLPIFLENAYEANKNCVTIYGSEAVLNCLRTDIFNDRVWPDFLRLSTESAPFLRTALLEEEKPVELEGLRITPIPVDHVVPNFGFLIEAKDAAVLIVGDTGPTERIWEYANRTPHLKGIFLEATFPQSLDWLAEASKHLTPARFAREVQKLRRPVRLIAVHIKARYWEQVIGELEELHLPNLEIGEVGRVYTF